MRTGDRKSTRLNSSHMSSSYAVFCLKKKKNRLRRYATDRTGPGRGHCGPGLPRGEPPLHAAGRPLLPAGRPFPAATLPFFFNDTATTEIYTLSLHDALPISRRPAAHPPSVNLAAPAAGSACPAGRSEEHTSELQSHVNLVCRLLLEKKK